MAAIKWKGWYQPCNCCGCGGSSGGGGGGGSISPGPTPNDGKTEFFYKSDQEPRLGYSTADQPYDNAIVIPGPNDGQLTFKDHEGNELGVFTADQAGDTEITLPQGFSGDYNDLINKPDINDGKFTIKDSEGNVLGEFTANQLGDSEVILPASPEVNDGNVTFKDENGDEITNHSANTPDDTEVTVVSQSYIDNSINDLSDEVAGEINVLRNELCYYDFNFNYKLIQGADPNPGECAVPFENPQECQMFRLHRTQLDGTQVDTTELHEDDILYFEQNLGDWIQYEVLRIDDLGPDHFQISVNYLGHGDNNQKTDPPKYYWDRPCLIYEKTQRPDDYDPCNQGGGPVHWDDIEGIPECVTACPECLEVKPINAGYHFPDSAKGVLPVGRNQYLIFERTPELDAELAKYGNPEGQAIGPVPMWGYNYYGIPTSGLVYFLPYGPQQGMGTDYTHYEVRMRTYQWFMYVDFIWRDGDLSNAPSMFIGQGCSATSIPYVDTGVYRSPCQWTLIPWVYEYFDINNCWDVNGLVGSKSAYRVHDDEELYHYNDGLTTIGSKLYYQETPLSPWEDQPYTVTGYGYTWDTAGYNIVFQVDRDLPKDKGQIKLETCPEQRVVEDGSMSKAQIREFIHKELGKRLNK